MSDHEDLWESVGTSEAYCAVSTIDRYGIIRTLVRALEPGGVERSTSPSGRARLSPGGRDKGSIAFPSVYGLVNKILCRDRIALPMY